MKILGIESSCDETAAAVVEDGTKVLSSVIASQALLHAKTGGVVPEVAAREHVQKIIPVVQKALLDSKTKLEKIDAIAVAYGPGLISSLLVGTTVANMIGLILRKPVIPVKHIVGHVYAPFLETGTRTTSTPQFPILTLTVSGGHNELYLLRDHFVFEVLGETADDAAGEAFDKVARMIGLPYPGGPAIEQAAKSGDRNAYDFPRAAFDKPAGGRGEGGQHDLDRLDFSFSGIKTAVTYLLEPPKKRGRVGKSSAKPLKLNKKTVGDLAASFQEAVCDALVTNVLRALEKHPEVREVHLTGGVSANSRLREMLRNRLTEKFGEKSGTTGKNAPDMPLLRMPAKLSYCTDNGAMIASAGYFQYQSSPQKYKEWRYVEALAAF